MNYTRCNNIEEYNFLNDLFTRLANYHYPSVQHETGTSEYATPEPPAYFFDEEDVVYLEQNEEGTLTEGYLFPVDSLRSQAVFALRGRKFYNDQLGFLFSA